MPALAQRKLTVTLPTPHPGQQQVIDAFKHGVKRLVLRAGRRYGKTEIAAYIATQMFVDGKRPLYGAPTTEQVEAFWYAVCANLSEPIAVGVYAKNETEHTIEMPGTKNRLKAKTCWNANTLRGDFSDFLILDEFQLMAEDAWGEVGAPMLLDKDGGAMFIYTPPSLYSSGVSKAKDPRHASKLFKEAKEDTTGRWAAVSGVSHDNPHLSKVALAEITKDMSQAAYRREILAIEDDDDFKGLIYKTFRADIQVIKRFPVPLIWPILTGHDFGGANPAALFLAKVRFDTSGKLPAGVHPYLKPGDYVVFHEYQPGNGLSTAQQVQLYKEVIKGYTVERSQGGNHQEEPIRQGYAAHGWPIHEPLISGKYPPVKVMIDRVIGMFENNRVYIFEDLYQTLFQLSNYSWKLDEQGNVTGEIEDRAKYHLMDCLRSILGTVTPETVTNQKVQISLHV
jgi:hypothetical protein